MERIVININGITFDMLPVEGGQFVMGATVEQHGEAYDNETPAHSVKLEGFYLGETVVTQTLWNAVMGDESTMSSELPVTGKSWNDCQSFIRRLNEQTGRHFRLPTEAEWEFAARGGKMSRGYKYAGSNNLDEVAWYEQNSGRQVHPVKQKRANELGFYDMSGNVWEWCADRYGNYDYDDDGDEKALLNPQGPKSGSMRVVRGAGNAYYAQSCRVSCRLPLEPTGGNYANTGFRLAFDENERYEQSNGSVTAATGLNEAPQQFYQPKGRAGENGNPEGAGAKGGKTGNGHYWKPTGGGSQHKKKKWPWIVAAAVALIVIIVAVSGGGEGVGETEVNPSIVEIEPEMEVVEEIVVEKDWQPIFNEINNKISIAQSIFYKSQLKKYDKIHLSQWEDKIKELNNGSEQLEKAAQMVGEYYVEVPDGHELDSAKENIIDLAKSYNDSYDEVLAAEEGSKTQMETYRANGSKGYDAKISESEERIAIMKGFHKPEIKF